VTAADLLVVNGRVFSADRASVGRPPGTATAVAVSGNRIAAVGGDRELADLRGQRTDVIDAGGGLIMPGFNDAHLHLHEGALSLDQLNLFGLTELSAVQRAIADWAAARPADEWIVGQGWLYAAFPDGLPTRQQLDEVVADRPAFLYCFDGHTAWANSRALELAGIDEHTPDPPLGAIVRDADGNPTGALKEDATHLVSDLVPQPDEETKLRLLGEAVDALARAGITAGQDAWTEPDALLLLDTLRGRRPLPLRLRVAFPIEPEEDSATLAGRLGGYEVQLSRRQDAFLRTGIVKGFLDGVVETRTAYMLQPYPGTSTRGAPNWTDANLQLTVGEFHRRGWQVELHAIGTAAVRQALDAYQALGAGEAARRRHRIEHIETIDPADVPRFAALGVVASMQPLHAIPVADASDTWQQVLAREVADSGWRMAGLAAADAVLAFGSDWPVVPFDPFPALHSAVNRQSVDGWPANGWLPSERLSIEQALAAFTRGSAYAEHADDERGSLVPGMLADLVVLDRDLLAEGSSAILGTRVVNAIVDGRRLS
jgi:predicted amidohydrolase YtcJ